MSNVVDFIKENIFPVLREYQFEISEELSNVYVEFASSKLNLRIAYNKYDGTFSVQIGDNGGRSFAMTRGVVLELFDSNLPIEEVKPEEFVTNIQVLLNSDEGRRMLMGNLDHFEEAYKRAIAR